MTRTIYSKAPITEAVIEIRSQHSEAVGFPELERVSKRLGPDYPKTQNVVTNEIVLQLGPKPLAESAAQIRGVRLEGKDPADVVQFRSDAIVVSRLAPYQRWEQLVDRAKSVWSAYQSELKPTKVSRMAVRYINRFDLPGPVVQLKDYFSIYPNLPEGSAFKTVGGMLLQLQVPQPSIDGVLVFNQALVPPVISGTVAVVLDMDFISEIGWNAAGDDIWKFAERLQVAKNEAFEAIITEKTRGLIS